LAHDWRQSNEVRAFVAALKSQPFDTEATIRGKTLGEWLAWADEAIALLDKAREGAEAVFDIVGAQRAEVVWMP
jgi:hypothetical protein